MKNEQDEHEIAKFFDLSTLSEEEKTSILQAPGPTLKRARIIKRVPDQLKEIFKEFEVIVVIGNHAILKLRGKMRDLVYSLFLELQDKNDPCIVPLDKEYFRRAHRSYSGRAMKFTHLPPGER